MKVNILGNFGLTTSPINPSFPQTGMWYEYFTADSINVLNASDPINLQPGEYRLYTTKKLASPRLILGINDHKMTDNQHFVSVYPNPSSETFNFVIDSPYPTPLSISIYDISGRIIRQFKTSISSDAVQSVTWDGKSTEGTATAGGMYFVLVRTSFGSETVKIIKE
jgi:hypothetical protein